VRDTGGGGGGGARRSWNCTETKNLDLLHKEGMDRDTGKTDVE